LYAIIIAASSNLCGELCVPLHAGCFCFNRIKYIKATNIVVIEELVLRTTLYIKSDSGGRPSSAAAEPSHPNKCVTNLSARATIKLVNTR
jgi:hypothetical protein